jgi:mRNA interferase RelE/StbE
MKTVTFSREAIKVLGRMPSNTAALIRSKVVQYATDPASLANNVKALKGRPGFRLRVGDWRVIMTEDAVVVAVLRIAPRGGAYE